MDKDVGSGLRDARSLARSGLARQFETENAGTVLIG
jgi:hypothetical protein